ncbi:MAG: hypothetical protein ACTHM9_10155 [Gemmatimonadales bacterium]
MDPGVVGVFIPIAAILAWAGVRIATIQAESRKAADPDTTNRLQALENELGALRQEMGETQERLDFAERLLAQRPQDRLEGGR